MKNIYDVMQYNRNFLERGIILNVLGKQAFKPTCWLHNFEVFPIRPKLNDGNVNLKNILKINMQKDE